MIPQGVQVFVALDPVDLRCSFDRLGAQRGERHRERGSEKIDSRPTIAEPKVQVADFADLLGARQPPFGGTRGGGRCPFQRHVPP